MGIQMRVTERSINTHVLNNLQRNLSRGAQLQEQLSSGKQISRPSDSPTGTLTSMQLRGDTKVNEQYTRNADDGRGWLDQLDSALGDSSTQVTVARNLTLQGLNEGTSNPAAREALAAQIDNIKDALIGLANTKYLDRPVFGGTATGSTAYAADGTYTGDAGQVTRSVGANVKVRVDVNGPDAFGTGDTQLFTVLQGISDSLRSNDQGALNAGLNKLDSARDLLTSKVSDVGSRYNRLTQAQDSAETRLVSLKSQLSDVEDIDLPKTIMEMKLQETSYEAALSAAAKVIQPSLIDYLR
jgi:flagellar hook-associated protein 3 FlgL